MGVFRDYFNVLYGTYLKAPIDGVKSSVYTIRDVIADKVNMVNATLSGFSDKVVATGTNIVTGMTSVLETQGSALRSALTEMLGPIASVRDIMLGFMPGYNIVNTIKALKNAHTAAELESIWDVLDIAIKENVLIVKVYNAVGLELKAQGLGSPADVAAGVIGEQIAKAIWKIEAVALPNIMEWIDSFAAGYQMGEPEIKSMKQLANAGEFGLNAVVNFMLGVTLYPAVMSAGEPAWMAARQEAYKALPVTLLDPGTLVRLKYKEMIGDGLYNDQFGKLGFDGECVDALEKDFLFYPMPQDFIRFAVRETFKPVVVEAYGYDNDFPGEMVPYAKKAGMSEEWLKHYWRAHWEIPSPRQGYEMLHRGVIDKVALEGLLKIGDYAPGWVQPLIDISYNPITRVDLRRLFADGVIDIPRVHAGYLELGYNEENAALITEWVVKSTEADDRELTKAEVLKSFRIGETSKDQAVAFLSKIGYSAENAAYVIAYEEYRLTQEERAEEIDTIISELIEGRYTIEEVKALLANMDVSIKQSNTLIQKAERVIRKRFAKPSKDDVLRWLKAKIITEEECFKYMIELHYQDEDIKRYLAEGGVKQ